MEKYNDQEAINSVGHYYNKGLNGLQVDQPKVDDFFQRASELGSASAHYNLGISYENGEGVEIDMQNSVHHYQIATMMGGTTSRHNLGCSGTITARCGVEDSLNMVKHGFKAGLVTKEDFERALRAYQTETKSEQRDRAAVIARTRE